MNWYKLKLASPMVDEKIDSKGYLAIGHDRTIYLDDVQENNRETMWIAKINGEFLKYELKEKELAFTHDRWISQLDLSVYDIAFVGRCSTKGGNSICSIRPGIGVMDIRNERPQYYQKLINDTEKKLDMEFDNPKIKGYLM